MMKLSDSEPSVDKKGTINKSDFQGNHTRRTKNYELTISEGPPTCLILYSLLVFITAKALSHEFQV